MKKNIFIIVLSLILLSFVPVSYAFPLVQVDNSNDVPHWTQMIHVKPSVIVPYDSLVQYHSYLISIGVPCKIVLYDYGGVDYYYIEATSDYDLRIGPSTQTTISCTGYVAAVAVQSGSSFTYKALASVKYVDDPNTWQPFYSIFNSINSTCNAIYGQLTMSYTRLGTIIGYVDQIEGYIDGIEGYIDGVETSLGRIESYTDGLETSLQDVISLLSPVQYGVSATSDSSGSSYSYVELEYDTASSICSYLNSFFVGHSVRLLSRSNDSVIGYYEFQYAYISGNRIRFRVIGSNGSPTTIFACSSRHVLFNVKSPNNINVSGDINATLDDTDIINALDTINDSINDLIISPSDQSLSQFCCGHLSFSDGSDLPFVTISYEAASNLVAILNAELQGKKIGYLRQDTEVYDSVNFRACYMADNMIKVVRSDSTSVNAFLMSRNHILIKYSDPTYKTVLASVDSKLDDIETALYGELATRSSTALVPVGETALSILNNTALVETSTSLILSDFGSLIAPEVGIIALAGDILDAITEGTGNSAITQRLDQIKNKIDINNNKLQAILDHLDSSDLADYDSIELLVSNWSSDVVTAISSSNNIATLFDAAFGDSAHLFQYSDWVTARDYFLNFFNS